MIVCAAFVMIVLQDFYIFVKHFLHFYEIFTFSTSPFNSQNFYQSIPLRKQTFHLKIDLFISPSVAIIIRAFHHSGFQSARANIYAKRLKTVFKIHPKRFSLGTADFVYNFCMQ